MSIPKVDPHADCNRAYEDCAHVFDISGTYYASGNEHLADVADGFEGTCKICNSVMWLIDGKWEVAKTPDGTQLYCPDQHFIPEHEQGFGKCLSCEGVDEGGFSG